MQFNFISMDEDRPPYGAPVLIKINGVVQHITYTLDGADETPDWFEPYHFDSEDELKIWWHTVDEWAIFPDWRD